MLNSTNFIVFAGIILCNSFSCTHKQSNTVKPDTPAVIKNSTITTTKPDQHSKKDTDKVLRLKYAFQIIEGRELSGNYIPFFDIIHNRINLFTDTLNNYELDEQKPILNKLKSNLFELLIDYDNSPNKNKTIVLKIYNDKIIKQDTIPTFDGKPVNINGTLFYTGILDNGEEWDENGRRYTSLEPKMYYKFTADGIKLDSAITKLKNKQMYGDVDVFEKGYLIGFPIDKNGHIDTITKHVMRKKISPLPKQY